RRRVELGGVDELRQPIDGIQQRVESRDSRLAIRTSNGLDVLRRSEVRQRDQGRIVREAISVVEARRDRGDVVVAVAVTTDEGRRTRTARQRMSSRPRAARTASRIAMSAS